jgi:hypothetical protein
MSLINIVDETVYVKPMDGPSHRDQQPSEEEEKKEADENDDEGELNVIEIFNHKCINIKKKNCRDFNLRNLILPSIIVVSFISSICFFPL